MEYNITDLIRGIKSDLEDPVIVNYLATGDDFNYDEFPMKHLYSKENYLILIDYFNDPDLGLMSLNFSLFGMNSYEEFMNCFHLYLAREVTQKEFIEHRGYYRKRMFSKHLPTISLPHVSDISIEKVKSDLPPLPDTCSIEEYFFQTKRDPDFIKFNDIVLNGGKLDLPVKKFDMYHKYAIEYNKKHDLPDEKIYSFNYYQGMHPKNFQEHDELQKRFESRNPVSEEEYNILRLMKIKNQI